MSFIATDQSWSGLYSPYIITKAMFSLDTLEKGLVAVDTGVKKIFTIERLDIQNVLSPRQAVPTAQPGSGWTNDVRTMTPGDFQTYQVVNPRDLEQTKFAQQLADAILEERVPNAPPADLQSVMMETLLGRAGESIETSLWQGSLAYAGHYVNGEANFQLQYFNGYLQRMVNDPLVNLSSISPAAITSSNIFAILDDLIYQCTLKYKALVTHKYAYRDMKFALDASSWFTYVQACANNAFKGMALDESGTPMWKGFRVERLAGLAPNTVIFSRFSADPKIGNFHVAMNSQKDWNVKYAPKDGNVFGEEWAFLAKWKIDVNYGWSDMIFLYTTLTAADFLPASSGE